MKKSLYFLIAILMIAGFACKHDSENPPDDPIIPPPSVAAILDFQANPLTIDRGKTSILSWNTVNATEISIDNGIGKVADKGTLLVKPAKTTAFTLTATGATNTVKKSVTITVNQPPVPSHAVVRYFTASKTWVPVYELVTLSWDCDARSVSISGIGEVDKVGSKAKTFSFTETVTLTAIGDDNQPVTASVTIQVDRKSACDYIGSTPYSYHGVGSTSVWVRTNVNKSEFYSAKNVVVQVILYDALNNIIEQNSGTIASIGPGTYGEVTIFMAKWTIADHSSITIAACDCDLSL